MKVIFIKNILHSIFLFAFLFAGNSGLFSQRIVDITYRQDARGAYVFSGINHGFCNYILEIHFTVFDNLKADREMPYRAEIKPGTNKLFSLLAVKPDVPVKFNYSSTYHKGCIHPAVDSDFTYLFPITPGKEAQVYEMSSPDKPAAEGISDNNWYVIRLKMKPGDTIYAARKGVVTEVEDRDGSNDAGSGSPGKENYIELVHADCSFGRYGILKKNGALVKPGQTVKAGQPIGLVGGDQYGRGSDIRFSVYYYQEEEVSRNGELLWKGFRNYIHLQCWTKNNGKGRLKHGAVYRSEFPLAVLNQESEKKSQKPRMKAKK
ncbi:MAG TPA: M23 family metallopeptidase [Puia sp.]